MLHALKSNKHELELFMRYYVLAFAFLGSLCGCTIPTGTPIAATLVVASVNVSVNVSGTAYFHSASNPPAEYPVAGTQHALKTGEPIDLQFTLTGQGYVLEQNALCPSPANASPFTLSIFATTTVTDAGAYATVLQLTGATADFGGGCTTSNFVAEVLTSVELEATIKNTGDTCTNFFVNKILADCENECAGNSFCLAQCPSSRLPGVAHGCSDVALGDPASPKTILAQLALSAQQIEGFRAALVGEVPAQTAADLNLEFSQLGVAP